MKIREERLPEYVKGIIFANKEIWDSRGAIIIRCDEVDNRDLYLNLRKFNDNTIEFQIVSHIEGNDEILKSFSVNDWKVAVEEYSNLIEE